MCIFSEGGKAEDGIILMASCGVCKHIVLLADAKEVLVVNAGSPDRKEYFCPEHAPEYDKEVCWPYPAGTRFYKKQEPWVEVKVEKQKKGK